MRKVFGSIVVILLLFAPNIDASEHSPSEFFALVNGSKFHTKQVEQSTTYSPGIMAEHITVAGGTMSVDILNFNGVGTYPLNDGITGTASLDLKGEHYSTNASRDGTVTVESYDAIHHMISGEISFSAQSEDGKSVVVKNGSFRVGD